MGSAVLPPATMEAMRRNMAWDGLFHFAVWVVTLVGAWWLLLDARRARTLPGPRAFAGQLLLGWDAFNLVEGLIDLLAVAGIGFMLLGWAMSREPPSAMPTARSPIERPS